MRLNKITNFLLSQPYANESMDGKQVKFRCPFCGDSMKNERSTHLSIKVDVDDGEPLYYQCFQPRCKETGILNTKVLQKLGCFDLSIILELANYNAKIGKRSGGHFAFKKKRDYSLINLKSEYNKDKLKYLNKRLGISLTTSDLKNLKIQLSLGDFLRVNNIKELTFKEAYCKRLDMYGIGFVSAYNDYIIVRDISKDNAIGKRYVNYRISGEKSKDDKKLYILPTDYDIMCPEPTVINISEGIISILGVYFNTEYYRDYRNQLFIANCGMGYYTTISHYCKQYGIVDVIINIWSDSEIPMNDYLDMIPLIKSNINLREFNVFYNQKKEDFGHTKDNIITIKNKIIE